MKALVFRKQGKIEWSEVEQPKILVGTDLIVKIEGFSFSHSDYRPYYGQDNSVLPNTIMGHEGVGIISEVGVDVSTLKVGDRVAIGCITHCNTCEWCKIKAYANCENGGFVLGTKINGTHGEYVRIPYGQNSVIKIPGDMELMSALMLCDVLPTGYENVIKKINFNKIKNVAIIGDGSIGLGVMLLLAKYEFEVDIFGHHLSKMQYFQENGAKDIFDSSKLEKTKKYDLVVECVGNNRGTFDLAQSLVNFNGTIIAVGVFNQPVEFRLHELWTQNITIKTGILNASTLLVLVEMIKKNEIIPSKLVSKIYCQNEVIDAYHGFEDKNMFKIVVKLEQ